MGVIEGAVDAEAVVIGCWTGAAACGALAACTATTAAGELSSTGNGVEAGVTVTRGAGALEAVPLPVLPELSEEPPLFPAAAPALPEVVADGLEGVGGVGFAADAAGGGVAVEA